MKIHNQTPKLREMMEGIDPRLELWKCHQCGQCSAICPSCRNGGIRTREVMELALLGGMDPSTEKTIWLCTLCNGCTERCQLGVDPASVIGTLRNLAAAEGNIPDHFVQEALLLKKTGLSFPITGLTKKLRKELDLEEMEVSELAKRELDMIISRTRLGALDIG